MKVSVPKGKYILAVSGGVDSMVLLHLLAQRHQGKGQRAGGNVQSPTLSPRPYFVVTHFNHGTRPDSGQDERLVRQAAKKYGLPFEVGSADLGPNVSEDKARQARYKFLRSVKQKHAADKIITAHHQDDLIETALLSIIRGTKTKGLTAIIANPEILRPLLNTPKSEILFYAQEKKLKWRDDPSNQNTKYLRNYLRRNILDSMTPGQRARLLKNINKIAKNTAEKDRLVETVAQKIRPRDKVDRQAFIALPTAVGNEVIAFWLRQEKLSQFDKKTVERLNLAIKTARPNSVHDVQGKLKLWINTKSAHFSASD